MAFVSQQLDFADADRFISGDDRDVDSAITG